MRTLQLKRFRNATVCWILISWMALPPIPAWAGVGDFPRGDVNDDGYIDALDVSLLTKVLLDKTTGFVAMSQADFNEDAGLDIGDVVSLSAYDGDWDDDGIPDIDDDYPMDNTQSDRDLSDYGLDTDNDGYAELIDTYRVDGQAVLQGGNPDDSDNDGVSNSDEATGWSNASGGPYITDSILADSDRDYLPDGLERSSNTNPLNPDTDGDGILDGDETYGSGAALSAPVANRVDREGKPRAVRRLTPEQIRINQAWQAEQEAVREKYRRAVAKASARGETAPSYAAMAAATGTSGRGLGFQGPESVGANFESVQSDKFSGAFSYTVPIKVPPGRGGFQPDLTLLYRSTNGDSWLGQGWDLNPGRIERSTKDGVPQYTRVGAGRFSWKTRTGTRGAESMAEHPIAGVSWYGAVAFCNWLSEKEGRTPCYDLANWQLTAPATNGYRLPTEAEWERAASWDPATSKHWTYGYASDTTPDTSRCNYRGCNPLGLSFPGPSTAPVGWFNGVNVNPRDGVQTVDSPSPAGCYDMAGNAIEWCADGLRTYTTDPQTDPMGPANPATGSVAARGGSSDYYQSTPTDCRTAMRLSFGAWDSGLFLPGFRLVTTGSAGSAMVGIPAGTFTMGRSDTGDDAQYGWANEDPRHSVTLSPYNIGKYEVTNRRFVEVLNWAFEQGYLENSDGTPYTGGDICKNGWSLLSPSNPNCQILAEESAVPADDGDPFTPLDNPDTFVYKTAAGDTQLVYTGRGEVNGQTCRVYHAEIDPGSFVRFNLIPDPSNQRGGRWQAW